MMIYLFPIREIQTDPINHQEVKKLMVKQISKYHIGFEIATPTSPSLIAMQNSLPIRLVPYPHPSPLVLAGTGTQVKS